MNWIRTRTFDLYFVIGPAILSSLFVLILYLFDLAPKAVSPIQWLVFVVFIDVAHVWSTIFRTYLHRENVKKLGAKLWLIPTACYFGGVFLYSLGELVFWRTLAYLAVFHFVRQQYGFYQIYAAKEEGYQQKFVTLDKLSIYACTLIPLLIWHFSGPLSINWFVDGDFIYYSNDLLRRFLTWLGPILLLSYCAKEIYIGKSLFLPRNILLLSTFLTWWIGIVWIQTDWAFTITNVVSHGIPYFALLYHTNMSRREEVIWPKRLPVLFMFVLLLSLGFIEEGVWDVLIWNEHPQFFVFTKYFTPLTDLSALALVIPLLALPQGVHYVLDGFIWKRDMV